MLRLSTGRFPFVEMKPIVFYNTTQIIQVSGGLLISAPSIQGFFQIESNLISEKKPLTDSLILVFKSSKTEMELKVYLLFSAE